MALAIAWSGTEAVPGSTARLSLRRLLLIGISITALVAALATLLVARLFLAHESGELLDAQLARAARMFDVALSVEQPVGGVVLELPESTAPQMLIGHDRIYPDGGGHEYELHVALQIFSADGRLRMRSANAPSEPITTLAPGFHDSVSGWRVFVLQSQHQNAWILVAEDDHARRELGVALSATVLLITLIGFAVLLAVLLVLVDRGLLPVRRLAAELARRGPSDFDPIPVRRLPAELVPLVDSLNQHLQRLQQSFRREQDFTARAAHELRTPLAALRIHTENALLAGNEEELRESLGRLREGIDRANRLVQQLLLLARLDPLLLQQQRIRVDCAELLSQAGQAHAAIAAARGQQIDAEAPAGLHLLGQAEFLLIALDALLDNALAHASSSRRILLRARAVGSRVRIEVIDQGTGLPAEQLARLNARSAGAEPSPSEGLGLTIAASIARAHGGRLLFENRPDGSGLIAAIELARAESDSGPAAASE
ncbi:MAG: hypothetical protein CVV18_02810 [Gammaproteobacteria bacterium HGW-Gammaproteobacteria-8]|nr:MAG: hypothetical protein CVV18_02810 [Gammaproteobacteria bacterium HGW-Gammaproteobacteria-8]